MRRQGPRSSNGFGATVGPDQLPGPDPSRPYLTHACPNPLSLQGTRQVTRAAAEFYGPSE